MGNAYGIDDNMNINCLSAWQMYYSRYQKSETPDLFFSQTTDLSTGNYKHTSVNNSWICDVVERVTN